MPAILPLSSPRLNSAVRVRRTRSVSGVARVGADAGLCSVERFFPCFSRSSPMRLEPAVSAGREGRRPRRPRRPRDRGRSDAARCVAETLEYNLEISSRLWTPGGTAAPPSTQAARPATGRIDYTYTCRQHAQTNATRSATPQNLTGYVCALVRTHPVAHSGTAIVIHFEVAETLLSCARNREESADVGRTSEEQV